MSISKALKRGLRSLRDQVERESHLTPWDIYRQIEHGSGGSGIASSADVRRAVRGRVRQKIGR